VETGLTIRRFDTPDELAKYVRQDVAHWQTVTIRQQHAFRLPVFQAPSLMSNFIPRPEMVAALKTRLLGGEYASKDALRVIAAFGLAGSGKSVMAAAIAHDQEIRQRFSDGILWATLGQVPPLTELLSGWTQALGDYNSHFTTTEAALRHLQGLLHEKSILFVIDDAWDSAHVTAMLAGGPRCAVLITTREAVVAKAVGVLGNDLYEIGVMTPEQSLELLARSTRQAITESMHPQALEVASAVGYLPLALVLAAAQVAEGVMWEDLSANLQAEIAQLENLDDPSVEDVPDPDIRKRLSLIASLNLSLRRLSPSRLRQFAWLGVLSEDAVLTSKMMTTLWEMDEKGANDALRYFRSKALLMAGRPLSTPGLTYQVHDVLHDMAKRLLTSNRAPEDKLGLAGLGLKLEDAHTQLLERYRTHTTGGLWHTVNDDGYIHTHLTWHMEKTRRYEDIHGLLREETEEGYNGWYQAHERLGQRSDYWTDVARAGRLAREVSDSLLEQNQPATSIGLETRYALITASLNSLAGNIPPMLIKRFVEAEIWTPQQGIEHARHIPIEKEFVQPGRRVQALEALASLKLPTPLLWDIIKDMLWSDNDSYQSEGLQQLARILPPPVLRQLCNMCEGRINKYQFLMLAVHLPDEERSPWVQEALEFSQTYPNEYLRTDFLAHLVPYLPALPKSAILELPELPRDSILQTILNYGQPTHAELWALDFAAYVRDLLPLTSPEILYEIYKRVWLKQMLWQRILPFIPDIPLDDITQMSMNQFWHWFITTPETELGPPHSNRRMRSFYEVLGSRYLFLELFLPHITDDQFQQWLSGALEMDSALRQVVSDSVFVYCLSRFAPYFSPRLLQEALQRAQAINSDHIRWVALKTLLLLPDLPPAMRNGVLQRATEIAQGFETTRDRVQTLSSMAVDLSEQLLAETLQLVEILLHEEKDSSHTSVASEALEQLSPYLPAPLVPKALDLARTIEAGHKQVRVLAALLPRLPGPQQHDVLRDAIHQACENRHFSALVSLAPYLSEAEWQKSLEMVARGEEGGSRITVLEQLVPHLPQSLLPLVLEIMPPIGDRSEQDKTLAIFVSHLCDLGDYQQEALQAAQQIDDRRLQAKALTDLIPHLPEHLKDAVLNEALRAAREIPGGSWQGLGNGLVISRSTALARVARHLSEPLQRDVLEEAVELEVQSQFPAGLDPLVEGISRSVLRSHPIALAEVSMHLAHAGYIQRALDVVKEVDESCRGQAIEWIVPHLTEPQKQEALDIARVMKDIVSRMRALGSLIHYLAEPLQEALETLLAATDDRQWIQSVVWLIPHLHKEVKADMLREGLIRVSRLPVYQERAECLEALSHYLVEPLLDVALEISQAIPEPQWRDQGMGCLARRLAELGQLPQALGVIRSIEDEAMQVCGLAGLAPYLNGHPSLLQEVLEMAIAFISNMHFIQGASWLRVFAERWEVQAAVMEGFAPYLPPQSRAELYRVWHEMFHQLSTRDRKALLTHLGHYPATLKALGGDGAVAETASAIQDVCRWWP
jgi:hypothetical protein